MMIRLAIFTRYWKMSCTVGFGDEELDGAGFNVLNGLLGIGNNVFFNVLGKSFGKCQSAELSTRRVNTRTVVCGICDRGNIGQVYVVEFTSGNNFGLVFRVHGIDPSLLHRTETK